MPVPLRASDVLSLRTFGAICAVLQQRIKQPGMYMAVVAICRRLQRWLYRWLAGNCRSAGHSFCTRTGNTALGVRWSENQ